MEILTDALTAIGGGTILVGASTAAAKYLIDRQLSRDMESFKAAIASENAIALEKLKAELAKEGKQEDRAHEYAQVMRRYQGPLQHAVYDLQSRLYNVVSQGLIHAYFIDGDESEKDYVVNNTTFVIAQYFAWAEIIRSEIQFIDCSTSENTKALSGLQDRIYSLWQADSFKDCLRIWAGEQRAVGETMIEERDGRLACIGYARFLELLESDKTALLEKLRLDVLRASEDIELCFSRLVEIQHALIDLLKFLDPEYMRFPSDKRTYVSKTCTLKKSASVVT